jgi:hypothetical protein
VGLAAACCAGVAAVGARAIDIGVVTTPELHFTVQTYNAFHALEESAYFTALLESFRSLSAGTAAAPAAQQPLHVDCANGVGALKLAQLQPQLARLGLTVVLYNTGGGRLNHMCGADYVQKKQAYPEGARVRLSWVLKGVSPAARQAGAVHTTLLLCAVHVWCQRRHGQAAAGADVRQPGRRCRQGGLLHVAVSAVVLLLVSR